jgi:peptidyl-tRNA hydrolase, PTH1 family
MSFRTLVVGLGNPGAQYRQSPHNLGFEVVDILAARLNAQWVLQDCEALAARAGQGSGELVLVKPQTWMNHSGRAVKALLEQHQVLLSELLVVCDDLALPFGRIRIRSKGGSGGHNGLRSIIDAVGSNEFARVRLGIFPDSGIGDASEYVLEPIGKSFLKRAATMVEQASQAVLMAAGQGILPAMNCFNRHSSPEKTAEG